MEMKNMYNSEWNVSDNFLNFNNLHTDYKAEVVALNLLNFYKDIDHVFLKRLGINNRTFKKDINSMQSQHFGFDENHVLIETSRESIYDYLPEGVFHTPTLGLVYDNIEQVVTQIQKQREIEDQARKFFEPFELESYFAEIKALDLENQYDLLNEDHLLVDIIADLWPILKNVNVFTAEIFIYLLPFIHAVKGDKSWFQRYLHALLGMPVNITLVPNVIKNTESAVPSNLSSEAQLGISTVILGNHKDGLKNWKIQVGPIPYNYMDQFVTGNAQRVLLNKLYDYFVPLNIEIIEEFITQKSDESFVLEPSKRNSSILGYSTFI